jgi:hypothetical protein
MKPLPGGGGKTTRSFHRPLQDYVNGLGANTVLIDRMEEAPGHTTTIRAEHRRAEEAARKEIPLFLGLRGRKVTLT